MGSVGTTCLWVDRDWGIGVAGEGGDPLTISLLPFACWLLWVIPGNKRSFPVRILLQQSSPSSELLATMSSAVTGVKK